MKKIKKSIAVVAALLLMSNNLSAIPYSGGALDCIKEARDIILHITSQNGDDPNGENFEYYIGIYNALYLDCMGLQQD